MADIFISYSSKDREYANALVEHLSSYGFQVWIDRSGIGAATSWSKEIAGALESCKAVILLLSESSVASKNVVKELSVAAELNKHIIPVELEKIKLSGDFLYHLSSLQRVEIENTDAITKALEKLGIGTKDFIPSQPTIRTEVRSIDTLLHLAVLPFDDLSPAKDNEWFADGMMDELINTLGSLEKLHVNPRTDVIYYKGKKPKIDELAGDLKCRYIIEGSVQKSGEKIRIRISLSDVKEHRQIWSEKYDGTFDDIFDLQDKTCFAIMEALKLKLTSEDEKKIEERPTQNAEAYELWLKGKEYYLRTTAKDYEHALSLYEEAARLDPNFAQAYASIANTSLAIYIQYSSDKKWLEKAEAAAEKVRESEGETALYYCMRSRLAIRSGKPDDALDFAKRSVELAPSFALAYDVLGFAHQALGNLSEAAEARRELLERQQNSVLAHFVYAISLYELKDFEGLKKAATQAIPFFERHMHLNPDDNNAHANFTSILQWAGREKEALRTADELYANRSLDGQGLYNLACLYLTLQKPERAMELLHDAIGKGYRNIETFRRDHDLDPLREIPEFKELMKKFSIAE